MDKLLSMKNRVAIVTGASGGIGNAVTSVLIRQGAFCLLSDNVPPTLEQKKLIASESAQFLQGDLSEEKTINEIFDSVKTLLNRPADLLINCAGLYERWDLLCLPNSVLETTMRLNVNVPFLLSQRAANEMISANIPGRIINISSDAWIKGPRRGAHYAASKAALVGMTRSMARALGSYGINVNCVSPGVTRTRQPGLNASEFNDRGKTIPLGRVAEPIDVAHAVLFLCSDISNYITGHELIINGGDY
ncbi:SDR family oxidoreductase [Methylomonas sp. Kb3]|uniref:SDR family NAD(P)-dependent oxidoreductase n=1 Tax=Methylomonas sp. Kb3 TaxID=1611544 RepID=UPI0013FDD531|nr:SDR family oxidoreductase [Methylomonas sp. Kb3]